MKVYMCLVKKYSWNTTLEIQLYISMFIMREKDINLIGWSGMRESNVELPRRKYQFAKVNANVVECLTL